MAFSGFDSKNFPGTGTMDKWWGTSPYQFAGYYLESPCHHSPQSTPWSNHRADLVAIGWGLAVLYVGYQQGSSACPDGTTRDKGYAHGQDAVNKVVADSFDNGTVVFLDVEPISPPIPAGYIDYFRGWIRAILDSNGAVKPGVYCHVNNADDLLNAAQQEYADAGLPSGQPRFWVTHPTNAFNIHTSQPSDSGVAYANIWQGALQLANPVFGGAAIDAIDENVADSANPSAP